MPESELVAVNKGLIERMEGTAALRVSLIADVGVGDNWDEAHQRANHLDDPFSRRVKTHHRFGFDRVETRVASSPVCPFRWRLSRRVLLFSNRSQALEANATSGLTLPIIGSTYRRHILRENDRLWLSHRRCHCNGH